MKERPILFSAQMVRALLAGTKTQTRRVVKNLDFREAMPFPELGSFVKLCPYGQPGDRLWVRESGWERPERTAKMMREGADTWPRFACAADGWSEQDRADFKAWGFKPRPSIHMPRWASRITLEITGVRVERLQDIGEADAIAEGVTTIWPDGPRDDKGPNHYTIKVGDVSYNAPTAAGAYAMLWDVINGPGSWEANPFVWVVTFRMIDRA